MTPPERRPNERENKLESQDGAKKPLGFDEKPAPPDKRSRSRRFVLKVLGSGVGAAYVAPEIALAHGAGGISPAPVDLPYHYELPLADIPTVMEDCEHGEHDYRSSGNGILDIDSSGDVTISGVEITGLDQGGGAGTVTIVQSGIGAGVYTGTHLNATVPVLYSDDNFPDPIPAVLTANGSLYQGGSNIQLSTRVADYCGVGSDISIGIGWGKATC